MQGWRRSMEDAHIAEVFSSGEGALFGVFDGHGGAEVARFVQKHLLSEIQRLEELPADAENATETLLVRAFHRMDDMLRDDPGGRRVPAPKGDRGRDLNLNLNERAR